MVKSVSLSVSDVDLWTGLVRSPELDSLAKRSFAMVRGGGPPRPCKHCDRFRREHCRTKSSTLPTVDYTPASAMRSVYLLKRIGQIQTACRNTPELEVAMSIRKRRSQSGVPGHWRRRPHPGPWQLERSARSSSARPSFTMLTASSAPCGSRGDAPTR